MKLITFLSLIFGFFCLSSRVADAAVLYPFTSQIGGRVNQLLIVEIRLDSESEQVNAIESQLEYDPDILRPVDISTDESMIVLWTEPPRVIAPGRIFLSGGIPDGTLAVGGRLATILFSPLRLGPTTLQVNSKNSGVYLHDSFGTPAALRTDSLNLTISSGVELLSQPFSPTHPIESDWSAASDVLVRWTPIKSALVSFALSRDPLREPDDFVEENSGLVNYPSLEDGRWYFGFREKIGQEWSETWHRIFQIDRTPPEEFELERIEQGPQSGLYVFQARDLMSGIGRYEALIERRIWWKPWMRDVQIKDVESPFVIEHDQSVKRVVVTAIDQAHNASRAEWVSTTDTGKYSLMVGLIVTALVAAGALLWFILGRLHHNIKRVVKRDRSR